MCDVVGRKAAERFSTVAECVRFVDLDHDQLVQPGEFHEFFRRLNLPEAYADRFFRMLDHSGRGQVSYADLCRAIGPYIQPGHEPSRNRVSSLRASAASRSRAALWRRERREEAARAWEAEEREAREAYEAQMQPPPERAPVGTANTEFVQVLEACGVPSHVAEGIIGSLPAGVDYHTLADAVTRLAGQWCEEAARPSRTATSPGQRRRPASARPARCSSQAELLRGSGQSDRSTASGSGPSLASASECGTEVDERRCRSHVAMSPRGRIMILSAPPKEPVMHQTWDSTLMKQRLGWWGPPERRRGLSAPQCATSPGVSGLWDLRC